MSEDLKKELDTTNPFNEGVTYDMFLKNIKGSATVQDVMKKHNLSKAEIAWIEKEVATHIALKNK